MPDGNGITTRVRVLEVQRVADGEQLDRIEARLTTFEQAWNKSREGLSRSEKIALAGVSVALLAAVIAAVVAIAGSAPT